MGIKFRVNENAFDVWGHEMAYFLGFLYADGGLDNTPSMRGQYIKVISTDHDIIDRMREWMGSEHTIIRRSPSWPNGKDAFLLRIGSHKLFKALTRHGLYPNKSLTVRLPSIPRKYIGDFIRGYFDGDGCVYLETAKGKTQQRIMKKLSVIFTSGSKAFLEDLNKLLKSCIRTRQQKVYESHRSFQLRLATSDSIKCFKLFYKIGNGLWFRRKFSIFENYFRLRPVKIDREVGTILRYSGGHVVK